MIKKIEEIADSIELQKQGLHEISLLTGKSGLALFYYYHSILEGDRSEYAKKSVTNIDEVISEINKGDFISTYCLGLAGFGWIVAFLNEHNFISDSDVVILDDIDDYLYHNMMADINIKNFDFLHGAIGYGIYFLKRAHKEGCKEYLKDLVNKLDIISVKEKDGSIKWESIDYNNNETSLFNISLSHGISSIINFLVRTYKVGIEQEKCKYLIDGAVKYLLKQEIDKNKFNSYFSSMAIESEEPIGCRLAWCYGDLGIAITLWQAGDAFKNIPWIDKSIEIMLFSATRRDLMTNSVMDAGLCHGTAGIGHIFYRMWWNTKLPEFKESADYWFDETIKMAYHIDGLAGYKVWRGGGKVEWINEVGLLEGVSGIGLALNTYYHEIEPTWDECLLLS